MPLFTYDTYQDVRKNLFYYSAITLNLAGFAAYQWILPPSHQQWVSKWFEYLNKNPVAGGLLKGGAGVAIFSGLAFVLSELYRVPWTPSLGVLSESEVQLRCPFQNLGEWLAGKSYGLGVEHQFA